MKSLQEIWEKIGGLEAQVTGLQTQNAQFQAQLNLLSAATVDFACRPLHLPSASRPAASRRSPIGIKRTVT
jgi:hypothetical protein